LKISYRPQVAAICCGFFFGFVSVVSALVAIGLTFYSEADRVITAPETPQSCHYQGGTFSAGAILRMGRIEKVCALVDGSPVWVRDYGN